MSGFLRDCIYGKQSADYHKNDVQTLKTPSILDITPACHLIEEEKKTSIGRRHPDIYSGTNTGTGKSPSSIGKLIPG